MISSPLVRAVQTAEILSEVSGLTAKHCRVDEHLSPGIDPGRLLSFLAGLDSPRVALVGHEPDMSHCVARFVGGGKVSFSKGAIACVEFAGTCALGAGQLAWFVTPRLCG